MARNALEPGYGLSQKLLLETSDAREAFERNPLFARAFADLVEARAYRILLSSFHAYYRLLEALIRRRREWRNAGLNIIKLDKTAWLEKDLSLLDWETGPDAPLACLPRISNLAEAAGAAFMTEYIAWNAEVAEKHLRFALPRSCQGAVHFVTAYGKSREAQWQRFQDWLDQHPWTDREFELVKTTAHQAFYGLDEWLKSSLEKV